MTDSAWRQLLEHGYVWLRSQEEVSALQEKLKPVRLKVTGQARPEGMYWCLELVKRKGKSACRY